MNKKTKQKTPEKTMLLNGRQAFWQPQVPDPDPLISGSVLRKSWDLVPDFPKRFFLLLLGIFSLNVGCRQNAPILPNKKSGLIQK